MESFTSFCKACPVRLRLCDRLDPAQPYKYFLCGKGCSLGVLFEDSVNVYFEWVTEDGRYVDYPAAIRYKAWPKRDVARLLAEGVWEASGRAELAA